MTILLRQRATSLCSAELSSDVLREAHDDNAEVLDEAEDHQNLADIAGNRLQPLIQRIDYGRIVFSL
jgi:hypothetical protein